MNPGYFLRKLQRLNSSLRVWCGDDDSRPAGLYYVKNGEYIDVCGVDKNDVPEFKIVRPSGMIVKQGWRDTVLILIGKRLADKRKAERVFRTSFSYRSPVRFMSDPLKDPLNIKRDQMWAEAKDGRVIDAKTLADLGEARKRRAREEKC